MKEKFHDFFPSALASIEEQECIISKRFPAFRAKAIDETQAAILRKASTKTEWIKGNPVKEIDAEANMLALILACVTFPDFQDATLQEAWTVMGSEALLKKMLLPGEYAVLSDWIAKMNGFDESFQEVVEQAKN